MNRMCGLCRSLAALSFTSLVVGAGCSQGDGTYQQGAIRQPIVNGTRLTDSQAKDGPWVTLWLGGRDESGPASGVLIAPQVVLTAAHNVDGVDVVDVDHGHYQTPGWISTTMKKPVLHRSYHRFDEVATFNGETKKLVRPDGTRVSRRDLEHASHEVAKRDNLSEDERVDWLLHQNAGVDLAVVHLAERLDVGQDNYADFCFEASLPTAVDVVGVGGDLFLKTARLPIQAAADELPLFGWSEGPQPYIRMLLGASPTNPNRGEQYTQFGDSGAGYFHPVRDGRYKVWAIHSITDFNKRESYGVRLDPFCNWINRVAHGFATNASFDKRQDIRIEGDGATPTPLENYVASLSGSGVSVSVLAEGDPEPQEYELALAHPPSELAATEIGTFSDGGPSLVFLDDGRLVSYHLRGPALSVTGATGVRYRDLMVANTVSASQPYNDLIAFRDEGGVDLYRGSSSGLNRVEAQVAVTRANDDAAADVVVIEGNQVTVSATSGEVTTATLPMSAVEQSVSAAFTRSGDAPGFDLAFLGNQSSQKSVAWCRMTSAGAFADGCDVLSLPPGQTPIRLFTTTFGSSEFEDLGIGFEDPLQPHWLSKGDASGLGAAGSFTQLVGVPSVSAGDGKFFLVGGAENTSPAAPRADFYIAEPVVEDGAPEDLLIQIFDLGMSGSFDHAPASAISTCVRLFASPNPGVSDEVLLKQVEEGDIPPGAAETSWYTLLDTHNGGHAFEAQAPNGTHWYHVQISLSEGCGSPPTSDHDGFNALKLRTNGQVRYASGLVLYASDFAGPYASFEGRHDTAYDGRFDLPFYVAGPELRPEVVLTDPEVGITLEHADADDSSFDLGGSLFSNADGARDDIYFELFKGSRIQGQSIPVMRIAGDVTTDLFELKSPIEDPSGDASGDDVAFERHATADGAGVEPGVYSWHWGNVGAENAIAIQPVTGSPVTHEYLAPGGRWVSSSVSAAPSALAALEAVELGAYLPVDLGAAGYGHRRTVTTVEAARELLASDPETLEARIAKELFALRLNLQRAAARGEPLHSAFVLSSRVSIEQLAREADALLGRGTSAIAPEKILRLLLTANSGQVTYLSSSPLILSTTDRDKDGIVDSKDNCPSMANSNQADADRDGVGDACLPRPSVWCVEPLPEGGATAVFGYESPLRDFRIPVGQDNHFVGAEASVAPPMLFSKGKVRESVVVNFTGDSVSWTVMGHTVTATSSAPRCSEVGVGALACQAAASPFHCCTSIEDCAAAARFTVYGAQSVELADRVRVVSAQGTPGSVISLGALVMGAEVDLGDVLSGGELIVGGATAIYGDVHVTGRIRSSSEGRPPTYRRVPIDAPDLSGFARSFVHHPSAQQVTIGEGEHEHLPPGNYREANIHGRVTLSSGTYRFTSLEILERASVTLDARTGPVFVQVASSASLRGWIDARPGELVLELTSPGRVSIGTNLAATVYAVNGRIDIEAPGTTHRGTLMAEHITVASDVTLVHGDPVALQ